MGTRERARPPLVLEVLVPVTGGMGSENSVCLRSFGAFSVLCLPGFLFSVSPVSGSTRFSSPVPPPPRPPFQYTAFKGPGYPLRQQLLQACESTSASSPCSNPRGSRYAGSRYPCLR